MVFPKEGIYIDLKNQILKIFKDSLILGDNVIIYDKHGKIYDVNDDNKNKILNTYFNFYLSCGFPYGSTATKKYIINLNESIDANITSNISKSEKINITEVINDGNQYILINNEADGNCGFQSIRNSCFKINPIYVKERNEYCAYISNQNEPQLLIDPEKILKAMKSLNNKTNINNKNDITFNNFVVIIKEIFALYYCKYVLNNDITCNILTEYIYEPEIIREFNTKIKDIFEEKNKNFEKKNQNRFLNYYNHIMSTNYWMDEGTILFYDVFLNIKIVDFQNKHSQINFYLQSCNALPIYYLFFKFKYKDNKDEKEYIGKYVIDNNDNIISKKTELTQVYCDYIIFLYNTGGHFQSIFVVENDKLFYGLYKYNNKFINNIKRKCLHTYNIDIISEVVDKVFEFHNNNINNADNNIIPINNDKPTYKQYDEVHAITIENEKIINHDMQEITNIDDTQEITNTVNTKNTININFFLNYIYIFILYFISFKLVYDIQKTEILGFIVLFVVYIVSTFVLIKDIQNKDSFFFIIMCLSYLFTFFSICLFVKMLVKIYEQNLKTKNTRPISFVEPYSTNKNIYKGIFVSNIVINIFLIIISSVLKKEYFYWDTLYELKDGIQKTIEVIFNSNNTDKKTAYLYLLELLKIIPKIIFVLLFVLPFYKIILVQYNENIENPFFQSIFLLIFLYILISSSILFYIATNLSNPAITTILDATTSNSSTPNNDELHSPPPPPLYSTSFYPQNSVWTKLMSPLIDAESVFYNLNLHFLTNIN
jgi:hypothetical protein